MTDYFQQLGIPRRYTLDLSQLERAYLERSRALHPDFHHNASEAQRRASLSLTAALNEAYFSLLDPYRRLEHLLKLQTGGDSISKQNLDQAFLMEMLDYREQIDAAKADGRPLEPFEQELQSRLREMLAAAGRLFDQERELTASELAKVRSSLNAAKTIQSLLREITEHLRADYVPA